METFQDLGIHIPFGATGHVRTLCPECSADRKKSTDKCLSVDVEEGVFFCHHCGYSGSLGKKDSEFDYRKHFEKPEYTAKTDLPENVVAWFAKRGISEKTLLDNRIGYGKSFADANGIQFPYYKGGEVVNIKHRAFPKKFRQEKNAEKCLYRFDYIKNSVNDTLIITEGECFKPDAEVLTSNGWKNMSDVGYDDLVLQVGDMGKNSSFVKPMAVIKKHYFGDIVTLSNKQRFCSITTTGHNMVVIGKDGLWEKALPTELKTNHKIPRVIELNGPGIDLSDDQIALQIAVSADSKIDIRKNGNVYAHFEFKKQRKISRLSGILNRLGLKYTSFVKAYGYTTFSLTLPEYILGKELPVSWIAGMAIQQRKFVIEEMVYWDGNRVSNRLQYEFSSKHYDEAKWMQTIAHTSGYTSTIMPRVNKYGKWFKVSVLLKKKHTTVQASLKASIELYNGNVHCVTVPTGRLLVRIDGCVFVCGNCDSLAFCEAGYPTVTSIPDGAPSANAKQFNTKFDFLLSAEPILEKFKKIILAVDNDLPGKRVEEELARRIGQEKCWKVVYPEGCKDANDTLVKFGKNAVAEIIKTAKQFPVEGLFSAGDYKDQVALLYEKGANRGFTTGWQSVDPYYTVKPCEFTVVTGIPGSGKSTWVDSLCVNLVRDHDWKILYFSPENWPIERHIQTLLEKINLQPFADNGRYSNRMPLETAMDSLEVMSKYFYFLYPPEDELYTVEMILEKARSAILRYGIRGVVIDPWNEIDHAYGGMTEAQYLSKALSKIRQFARKNAVHIWVVAHPKNLIKEKDGSYKPPTMYEISGGAHWRNKADNGLCIHRPDPDNDITEIYVQKIRFKEVGKRGKVQLRFSRDTGTYNNFSRV